MRRIIVEYEKCDGCKNCSAACMQAHRETGGTIYDLDLTDPGNESRNYILKDEKDVVKVFLYSDEESKVKRAIKYYKLKKEHALKTVNKTNKERAKHYKFYTNQDWYNVNNYDIMMNVDKNGVEKTADYLRKIITKEEK